MFALEWLRRADAAPASERLAASLAAGLSAVSAQHSIGDGTFAALLPHGDPRRARAWRPVAAGPHVVLFHGHLDNAAAAAAELGQPAPLPGDHAALARLYSAALLTWGDAADRRLIGEYAVAVLDQSAGTLRLARSPLRAPPLHYHAAPERVIASTAVRAIFACGVKQRLNDAKIADMAWFNASNEARGWYVGVDRVPLGSVVMLGAGGREETRGFYDLDALPPVPRASRAELVEQAQALLAEGTRAALAGSKRPAVMLSGGLDSAMVVTRVLDAVPGDAAINAYTFVPAPDWDGHCNPGYYGTERPRVEALCAMHPRIAAHFEDNADTAFTDRLELLFHTIGGSPQGLANLGVYHRLWEAARRDGCDRVLLGEFGNATASADGSWAFSEYLASFRWTQLYRALRYSIDDHRSLLRRFLAMAVFPFLPERLWHWQRRVRGIDELYGIVSPLRMDYAERTGVVERARAVGLPVSRYPDRDRLSMIREIHANAWGEFSDLYSGFEQVYGMDQRDPTAYRPFFEFCAGLPSDMFLYDGQQRWLARELLRGRVPEEQRLSSLIGSHNADWRTRLGARRGEMLAELDLLEREPRLAEMFDFPRVRALLEDWPETTDIPIAEQVARAAAISRAILFSRFVNYVEGRNLG